MEAFYVLIGIGFLILQIVLIVKFFQIAANVKAMKAIQLVNFKKTYFVSDEYLELIEAVKDFAVPETTYSSNYGGEFEFKFNEEGKLYSLYKESGLWCCYNNAGQTVYARSKDEALKFCYYFSIN